MRGLSGRGVRPAMAAGGLICDALARGPAERLTDAGDLVWRFPVVTGGSNRWGLTWRVEAPRPRPKGKSWPSDQSDPGGRDLSLAALLGWRSSLLALVASDSRPPGVRQPSEGRVR